jgi:hypothetical protein
MSDNRSDGTTNYCLIEVVTKDRFDCNLIEMVTKDRFDCNLIEVVTKDRFDCNLIEVVTKDRFDCNLMDLTCQTTGRMETGAIKRVIKLKS